MRSMLGLGVTVTIMRCDDDLDSLLGELLAIGVVISESVMRVSTLERARS